MADLSGVIAPDGGSANRRGPMSSNLSALTIYQGAARLAIVAAQLAGSVAFGGPAHQPQAILGAIGRSFYDDYYNRVHVIPSDLPLGNLVSVQERDIYVWSAWLDQANILQAVQAVDADGITIMAPGPVPMTFAPLQGRTWSVSVSTEGPPTIDATLTWVWNGLPPVAAHITGNRITAWSFAPNWSTPITETLEWLTDVQVSPTGAEQRSALRVAPRTTMEASMLVEGVDRTLLDLSLYGWGGRRWALPIWHDVSWLAVPTLAGATQLAVDTVGRDYVAGGLAMLRGLAANEYEVLEIDQVQDAAITLQHAVQADWPVGTRLYPMRTAQLSEQPQLSRLSDTAWSGTVRFQILDPRDWSEQAPTTIYRGRPVIETAPDETQDLTQQYQRLLETIDNDVGVPELYDTAGVGFPTQQHSWMLFGRAAQATFRGLLYALRGQQVPVWLPTFAADLMPVATTAAASTAIDIQLVGYSRFGGGVGRRDVRIELADGTVFYRRLLGGTQLDATTERVQIDTALGRDVAAGDVRRISFMALVRQTSDAVEISHVTDSDGVASASSTLRGVRDDLEAA